MRRRTVYAFAAMLLALATLTAWVGTTQLLAGCHRDQRTWATLRRIIDTAYQPPPAFHLTPAQRHLIALERHRVEAAQGDRPAC